MPIHPTPVTCEMCDEATTLSLEGLVPPGWLLLEASETLVVQPETPEIEFPEGTPPELAHYMVGIIAQVAGDEPRVMIRRGKAVYCPVHRKQIHTKIDFPEVDEWTGSDFDDEEG